MVTNVRLVIGELELRHAEVEQLVVRHAVSEHTSCRVVFTRDAASAVTLEDLLGQPVEAHLTVADESREGVDAGPVFSGSVVAGTQRHLPNRGSRIEVEARSASWLLQAANLELYKDMPLEDLAKQVLSRHGLSLETVGSIPADPREWVQTGESDFDFLVRAADQAGAFLDTRKSDGVSLVAEVGDQSAKVVWGRDLHQLAGRSRPLNTSFQGGDYDPATKEFAALRGVSEDPDFLGGASTLVTQTQKASPESSLDYGADISRARTGSPDSGQTRLKIESRRRRAATVIVEGETENPYLQAGTQLEISEGENRSLATRGKFTLLEVVHQVDEGLYTNTFVATPWEITVPLRRPIRRQIIGPTTAVVTENVDPDALGRVRVRYWWHETMTEWARVVTLHAGANRGSVFLPEVDDEVLVAFEQGDPERPLVIGSLWNGVDKPPDPTREDGGSNELKRIVTRSGNTILLDDTDGREVIEVYPAGGKCAIQLHNDVAGTPTINVYSEGDICLNSGKDISLDAGGNILLKSSSVLMQTGSLHQEIAADYCRSVGGTESAEISKKAVIKTGDFGVQADTHVSFKAGMNFNAQGGAVSNVAGGQVQIQPPGFQAPPAQTKKVEALEPKGAANADLTPSEGSPS